MKKEKTKLKKHRDYLFSKLLPLIKDSRFFDPEKKAYRFHHKLENGQDLFLSLAKTDDDEMLVLTAKNPNGKVSAEFTDFTSNKSPYPITCSETLLLSSSFSKKGKREVTKRYLLFLEHGLVGLMLMEES